MADAEIRFKAVLQDDASRGIEQLDAKVKSSGTKAATANREIGRSAANAARDTGTAASRIGSAYQSAESAAKRAANGIGGALSGAVRAMGNVARTAATAGANVGRSFAHGVKSHVDKVKADVNAKLKDLGRAAIQGFTIALAGLGVGIGIAIKEAAAYEQSIGAIEAVFKGGSDQMFKFASDAATTMGLSRNQYQELATVLGASLKNGGTSLDELGGKTNNLIQTGADLASMFGGTTKDAVSALTATLRGEFDPIERYGITLRASSVEAEALAMGANKVNGEFSTQAKQAAILSLIMKQSADAQGNFAREVNTLSGATQILKAQWQNFYTDLASNLVPILAMVVSWLSQKVMPAVRDAGENLRIFFSYLTGNRVDVTGLDSAAQKAAQLGTAFREAAGKVAELWGKAQPFFAWIAQHKDVFGTLALGIGIAAGAMAALTAATWLLNAALVIAFSPVVIVGLFIGALILAYNKLGWFKDFVHFVWNGIKTVYATVGAAIVTGWNTIANTGRAAWQIIQTVATTVATAVRTAWDATRTFFTTLWTALTTATRVAWDTVRNIVMGVVNWFTTTARATWEGATKALGTVMTWLNTNVVQPVWNAIRMIIAVQIGIILTLWDGLKWALEKTLGPAFRWFNDSVVQPVWTAVKNAINAVSQWWTGVAVPNIQRGITLVSTAWNVFKALVSTVWNAIRSTIQTMWAAVQAILQSAINFIKGAFTAAWNYIRDTIQQRWQAIRTVSSQAWSFVKDQVFQPTINFIRGALTSAWNFIRDTITNIWTAIRARSSEAWNFLRNTIFQPVINMLRGPFTAGWTFVRDSIANVWTNIRNRSSDAWNWIRNNALEPMRKFVRDTIPNAFASARDAIGRAWDGIKKKILDPVNEVIRIIKNTLIGNINSVLKAFGMNPINVGFNAPSGGKFREGGYTGPGHPGAPAGVVHRDEQVIRSPARRSIEDEFPGLLDRMNRFGAAALGSAAPGAAVYGGARSFTGGLTQQVFNTGRLNVSGSAPGYDLAGAIRMVDAATKVNVRAGGGSPSVNVTAGNYPDWWAGYFSGNSIRLNNRIAGGMNAAAKRILVAHEIGHALGLPHSDPSGLKSMMSYANMYQHNSVTSADVAALSAIYGGTGFASGPGGVDWMAMLTKGLASMFSGLTGRFSGVGGTMASGAGSWMLKKAVEWGTKKFAGGASRGMILPGYDPGDDRYPLMASGGEAVLAPQLVRALGAKNVASANLAATGNRAGGSRKALSLLSHGGGGVTIEVNLDVTIEGNADREVIDHLRDELEPILVRIIDDANRRGY